jgi:hypothetical protein
MIAPEQEKSMAKQMNATTTVLPSSHVAMLSHPKEVAKVIEDAATGKKRTDVPRLISSSHEGHSLRN